MKYELSFNIPSGLLKELINGARENNKSLKAYAFGLLANASRAKQVK